LRDHTDQSGKPSGTNEFTSVYSVISTIGDDGSGHAQLVIGPVPGRPVERRLHRLPSG
jgi:hypothetical protein